MNSQDRTQLGNTLNATMSVLAGGKPLNADQLDLWISQLERHNLESIYNALNKYVAVNKFAPAPSDILDILMGDKYPTPEEAWNRLPKGEDDGGYMSEQMREAWGACMDSLDRGDMVGARMAFIESYKKHVERARLSGEKAEFFYSSPTGLTLDQRMEVKHQKTLEAVDIGWLEHDSPYVRQILAITSEKPAIALEDLTRRIPNLSKAGKAKKESALADIREKLR